MISITCFLLKYLAPLILFYHITIIVTLLSSIVTTAIAVKWKEIESSLSISNVRVSVHLACHIDVKFVSLSSLLVAVSCYTRLSREH